MIVIEVIVIVIVLVIVIVIVINTDIDELLEDEEQIQAEITRLNVHINDFTNVHQPYIIKEVCDVLCKYIYKVHFKWFE